MSPDGITLNLIIRELQEMIIPSRVERVYQPEKQEIVLNLRSSRKSRQLLISAQAETPASISQHKKRKTPSHHPFSALY